MIVKIPPNTIIWIGFIRGDPTGSNSAASPWKTKQAYNKTRNEDCYTEPALIEKVHYPFMKLDDSLTFRNCESSKKHSLGRIRYGLVLGLSVHLGNQETNP